MLKSRYRGQAAGRSNHGHRRARKREASKNAQYHERHRLDNELPDDPRAPRAKRHPHTELTHPRGGPRHHKIAEIRCGDDEDEGCEAAEQCHHREDRSALARSQEVMTSQ